MRPYIEVGTEVSDSNDTCLNNNMCNVKRDDASWNSAGCLDVSRKKTWTGSCSDNLIKDFQEVLNESNLKWYNYEIALFTGSNKVGYK